MSRADLARATGLTRVTISALIADLIDEHYVVEIGLSDDVRPGKPATMIDLDTTSRCVVTLDLSGNDALTGAQLTVRGEVISSISRPRPADGPAILEAALQLVTDLVASAPGAVAGVGVGTPGIVDANGTVLSAPNFGWEDVALARLIGERVDVPVIVTNDANAAVLGEFIFGGSAQDVLLIRIGRGVGSGLLTCGRVLAGSHLAGGELGHVTVGTDGGPQCACGKVGCLEAWLAESALAAHVAAGDTAALRAAGERLGIALAPVLGVLDISEILLSGRPELLDGELKQATIETLRARTLTDFHDAVEVRMAGQGDDIVLRGAAVPVLNAQLGLF